MKTASLYLITAVCALAQAPTFRFATPIPFSFSSSPDGAGLIYKLEIASSPGEIPLFGPIHVWLDPKTGKYVQITDSLSSLDHLCRLEVAALGQAATEKTRQDIIVRAASLYGRKTTDFVISKATRAQYLSALKDKVDAAKFKEYEALLPEPEMKFSGSDWNVRISIVTLRGAIERSSLSGGVDPLSIRKYETEVLAPEGTLPSLDFMPRPEKGG